MAAPASAMLGPHWLFVNEWKLQLVQPKKQIPEISPSHRILHIITSEYHAGWTVI